MRQVDFVRSIQSIVDPGDDLDFDDIVKRVVEKFTSEAQCGPSNIGSPKLLYDLTGILDCFERGYPKAGRDRLRSTIEQLRAGGCCELDVDRKSDNERKEKDKQ
jgi:hypothetical protein